MTPQQLLGIAVRLFALWLGLSCIQYWVVLPTSLRTMEGTGGATLFVYIVGAIYAVAALLLWFFPMLVAHRLLPRTRHDNLLSAQGHELARVGCALLGLWLFAHVLPELARYGLYAMLSVPGGSLFSRLEFDRKLEFGVTFFNLVLALALIVKANGFAILITGRSATAMHETAPQEAQQEAPQ